MEKGRKNKEGMDIKKAFYQALQIRNVCQMFDLDKSTVSKLKTKADKGEYPKHDTMKNLLQKAGYKIIQEELWIKQK